MIGRRFAFGARTTFDVSKHMIFTAAQDRTGSRVSSRRMVDRLTASEATPPTRSRLQCSNTVATARDRQTD